MEHLGSILSALNDNKYAIILLFSLLFILSYGIKHSIISFNGHGLRVGQDADTRNLIQSQFEYAHAKIEGVISRLPNSLDIYHTKYVLARVEIVILRAIIFNNMTDDEDYIRAKQEMVYQTVMKRITNDYFKTDEFRAFCYKFTNDLFKDLVRMKKIHG